MTSRLWRSAAGGAGTLAFVVAGLTPASASANTQVSIDGYTNPVAIGDDLAQIGIGRIPFTAATVTPGASSGSWTASWTAQHTPLVAVFYGSSATRIDKLAGIAGASGSVGFTLPATTVRPWVRLVPLGGSPLVVSNRDLGLASDPNMRDIGGYRTSDGRWVKEGLVYRSQVLNLSSGDAQVVNGLGISNIYDLRTPAEISKAPDLTFPGATWTNLDVEGLLATSPLAFYATLTPYEQGLFQAALTATTAAAADRAEYGLTVTAPVARNAFHDLLTGIANASGAVVFHCSAGKDRSGVGTALLLTALGVPYSTVEADYLISNVYDPNGVDASYLQAAFDSINTVYGSFSNYLTAADGLNLSQQTIAKLRQRLLTGAPQS